MRPGDLQHQIAATESYLRLLKEAEECRKLYQRAGMTLPPALAFMFGAETGIPYKCLLGCPLQT